MFNNHTLFIILIGNTKLPRELDRLDFLPIAKEKLHYRSVDELAINYPQLVPYSKSGLIIALLDTDTKEFLRGRVFGFNLVDGVVVNVDVDRDHLLASVFRWLISDEPLVNLYVEKKQDPPVLVIVTGNSHKSKLFKERVLPKLMKNLEQHKDKFNIKQVELNDNGIASQTVPKDLYNWIAWFPFIGVFTNKSYVENKDLTGFVFRGILDDYWENEYKVCPDPNATERYNEQNILSWLLEIRTNIIFEEPPKIPKVSV